MSEQDWLAQRFEEHRHRLRAVAYRMLATPSARAGSDRPPREELAVDSR